MTLKNLYKGKKLESDQRQKEEAKSEGHNSDEEEFQGNIMGVIKEEKSRIQMQEDVGSDLSSLPSETDE